MTDPVFTRVEMRTVAHDDDGVRLDRWFKKHVPGMKHGQLEKALRKGQVRVDGARAKAATRLESGQEIRVPPYEQHVTSEAQPKKRPVKVDASLVDDLKQAILYQDDHVLVINKPAGLAVQGGTNTKKHVDGALEGLKLGAAEKPRLVHRLDKDTSGVLVLGRTAQAARALTAAFKARDAHKVYWAVVVGVPSPEDGRIKAPIDKRAGGRGGEKMTVTDDGKPAITEYVVMDKAGRRTALLGMAPLTGRTHQLRVHCAEILETPIMGDGKYGGEEAFIDGLPFKAVHLHARVLDIAHPNGGRLRVEAPLSADFRQTMTFLGLDASLKADPFEGMKL